MKPRSKARAAPALWNPEWGRCPEPNGKRRFPTRTAAKRAARLQPHRAFVYRCDACGDLHLCRAHGIAAAIRYLQDSLHDDRLQAARRGKGDYAPA